MVCAVQRELPMFALKVVRVGRTEKLSHRRREFYIVVYQTPICMSTVKVIDQTVLTPVTPHALFGITYFLNRDEKPFISRTNSIADHSPLFVDFIPAVLLTWQTHLPTRARCSALTHWP